MEITNRHIHRSIEVLDNLKWWISIIYFYTLRIGGGGQEGLKSALSGVGEWIGPQSLMISILKYIASAKFPIKENY